jgi:hypothetical protein
VAQPGARVLALLGRAPPPPGLQVVGAARKSARGPDHTESPMANISKLTDLQIMLLTAAAADGAEATSDTAKSSASLIKRGLLISVPRDKAPSRLIITDAGRAAIDLPPTAIQSTSGKADQQALAPRPSPKGKLGAVVALLRRPGGATVEEVMGATGWQAHSVRGAISGAIKKKLALQVTSDKTERGRVYRIVSEAA